MRRLCTREKYLKTEENAHELPYNILTFLLKEPRSAGLKKEENRDEEEFRALNKITLSVVIIISLSISNSRIF
jgi:hypothetical protein